MALRFRLATPADAAACLSIYAPIVEHTPISFELIPPTPDEFADRIRKSLAHSLWLIAEHDSAIAGYAYGSQFRARPAYDWTAETTIYIRDGFRGRGIGHALYRTLLRGLQLAGFRSAMAGSTFPNEGSARLHESVGFTPIGRIRDAGYKFDRWHDTIFWQAELGPGSAPRRPIAADQLSALPAWHDLLAERTP